MPQPWTETARGVGFGVLPVSGHAICKRRQRKRGEDMSKLEMNCGFS